MSKKWLISTDGLTTQGPFATEDLYSKIQMGNLTWVSYAWHLDEHRWVRICEIHEMDRFFPKKPDFQPSETLFTTGQASALPLPPEPSGRKWSWYIRSQNTEFGPFAPIEILELINKGALKLPMTAWKKGMAVWLPLEQIPELKALLPARQEARYTPPPMETSPISEVVEIEVNEDSSPPVFAPAQTPPQPAPRPEPTGAEKRTSVRIPVNALVSCEVGGQIIHGVCRDLSTGGMLVIMAPLPGQLNSSHLFQVEPSKDVGLPKFQVRGTIVRIRPDKAGFGVKFDPLSSQTEESVHSLLRSRQPLLR